MPIIFCRSGGALNVAAAILHLHDFSRSVCVVTDAGNVGIGAVLYEVPEGWSEKDGIKYISFLACSLQESERKHSTTQKAVVFALQKFYSFAGLLFYVILRSQGPFLSPFSERIEPHDCGLTGHAPRLNVRDCVPYWSACTTRCPRMSMSKKLWVTATKVNGYVHLIQDIDTARNDESKVKRFFYVDRDFFHSNHIDRGVFYGFYHNYAMEHLLRFYFFLNNKTYNMRFIYFLHPPKHVHIEIYNIPPKATSRLNSQQTLGLRPVMKGRMMLYIWWRRTEGQTHNICVCCD